MSIQPLTESSIRGFAEEWYRALDRHDALEDVLPYLVDDGLEMVFPEGTSYGHEGFTAWYKAVSHRFFDEEHTVTAVIPQIVDGAAEVQVNVNWQARIWNPPAATSTWLGFDADQTWVVVATENGPKIKMYVVNDLAPMPGSASL